MVVDGHARRLDPHEPETGGHDHAGEPHAAEGGMEEVRVLAARTAHHGPVGHHHVDPLDEHADRPVPMVVLPVDVGRDGAPDGHVLRPRRRRQEPSARQEEGDDLGETDTGLDVEEPRLRIEAPKAIDPRCLDDRATRDEGGVSIGPAEPAGDEAGPVIPLHNARHPRAVGRGRDDGVANGKPPPSAQRLGSGAHAATPSRTRPAMITRHKQTPAIKRLIWSRMAKTTGSSSR